MPRQSIRPNEQLRSRQLIAVSDYTPYAKGVQALFFMLPRRQCP
jgi:hypothetical protein